MITLHHLENSRSQRILWLLEELGVEYRIVAKVRAGYLDPNLERNLAFMESSLAGHDWFCGDRFTAADIQMSFAVEAAALRSDLRERCPWLSAFLERIHARPAYAAALEQGGPFQLLG